MVGEDNLKPKLDADGNIISDHRGAFGEFGATVERGFIDRSFREKIIIVGVILPGQTAEQVEISLDELERLVNTAGADVIERIVQKRDSLDPATYIGSGKVKDIYEVAIAHDVDTVIFDDELSPGQQFNLEKILKRSALDRTAVILDIFAQHATSAEGKAQVELAQLQYRLPRLRNKKNFSQQGGGIGTRGPGETQLEVDRRRLERRLHKLRKDLTQIEAKRSTQAKASESGTNKKVSIVGYTNAGKSSLLRYLTSSDVLVEDKLFATLDSTTRKYKLPGGETILLSDTVGFIRKLPHQLVEAFASTLRVATSADLLVHLVDGSSSESQTNIDAVHEVLTEIGAGEIPTLLVFNKIDKAESTTALAARYPDAVFVSAETGENTDILVERVAEALRGQSKLYKLFLDWSDGSVLAELHRVAKVNEVESEDEGMIIEALIDDRDIPRFETFIASSS